MTYISHTHDTPLQERKSIVSDLVELAFSGLKRVLEGWRAWQRRSRERAELRGLSSRELSDIGLSKADVYFESVKPRWRK